MINYGHVRFLFSKLFIPVTGRFLKRSPIRTADCSSCQVRALAEAIARDSPASKFASLVHTLPRDASPATSTLGTLVIFVKEAPSASLRPERERERAAEHTCIYITRRNRTSGERERERDSFSLGPRGFQPPLLFGSSSGGSLQTEPPRPLAASFKLLSVLEVPERFHGSATIKRG